MVVVVEVAAEADGLAVFACDVVVGPLWVFAVELLAVLLAIAKPVYLHIGDH